MVAVLGDPSRVITWVLVLGLAWKGPSKKSGKNTIWSTVRLILIATMISDYFRDHNALQYF